jgi:hypothetical protein
MGFEEAVVVLGHSDVGRVAARRGEEDASCWI